MFQLDDGKNASQPLYCQEYLLRKAKSPLQVFSEGLKAARLRLTAVRGHYVTPEELGKDVGVSGQTIRNYESGASEPTLEMIEKLAKVLGVELSWPPFASDDQPFHGEADPKKLRKGTD